MNKFFSKLTEKPEYLVYSGLAVLLVVGVICICAGGPKFGTAALMVSLCAGLAYWFGRRDIKVLEQQIALMKTDANELHESYVEKLKQLTSDNDRLKELLAKRLEENAKAKEVPAQESVEAVSSNATPKKRGKKVTIADIKSEINKNKPGK